MFKFRERRRFIKSLNLGLALSPKAFNQIAVTAFRFIVLLFPSTVDVERQVHLGLQSLTCSPTHATPGGTLCNLTAVGNDSSRLGPWN
eukprot:3863755-Pyramimonas_sp.AAC.1